jgi:transcriptional regulator with XRE-family HTH domain
MSEFHLNDHIARLRKKNNMTQEKFASLLGVTNQAVSKWEAGTCCPDIQLLPAIAQCFGVSIDALFTQNDYESRARLLNRYNCTGRDEDFAAALDAYEKVIAGGSATIKDLADHAFLFNYRGCLDLGKAEKLYEDALRVGDRDRDETYYFIHANLIRMLCRRSRNEEVIARYTQMTKEEPDNWWSYALLSLAYWMSGKSAEAWELTQKSLELSGNWWNYTSAGDLRGEAGDDEAALGYWEKAYVDNPKQIACLYSAAFLLEKLERRPEAIAAWRRILQWHQENDYYRDHETDVPMEHLNKLLASNE